LIIEQRTLEHEPGTELELEHELRTEKIEE